MRRFSFGFVVGLALLVVVAACAPKTAPAPPAAPATPSAAPAPAATPTPAPKSEWQKVIDAAKQEGTVTLYTFGFTGDIGKAVSQGFEQAYGIKVETVGGVGTVLMERIQSEHAAGKYLADTLDTAPALVATAKTRGMTQSWGNLPAFAEKGVWRLHPKLDEDGHMFTIAISSVTAYINTTLVKPGEEPKSIKDLLDPKWKGKKLAIGSPVTDPLIIYWYVAKLMNDDFMTQLAKQELVAAPTVRDSIAALARGEVAVVLASAESLAAPLIAKGAPIKPIELAEGALAAPSVTMTLVKNAPHPNAARLFGNWLLSKEGQTAYHKARATAPIRNDLPSYLPPEADLQYKKVTMLALPAQLEISKLQREGTVAKLLGVAK